MAERSYDALSTSLEDDHPPTGSGKSSGSGRRLSLIVARKSVSEACGPNDAELSWVEAFDADLAEELLTNSCDGDLASPLGSAGRLSLGAEVGKDMKPSNQRSLSLDHGTEVGTERVPSSQRILSLEPGAEVSAVKKPSNQSETHRAAEDDKASKEHRTDANKALKQKAVTVDSSLQVLHSRHPTEVCFCDVWVILGKILGLAFISVGGVGLVAEGLSRIASTSRATTIITFLMVTGQSLTHVCITGLYELDYSLWELVHRLLFQSVFFPILCTCIIAWVATPAFLRMWGDFILSVVFYMIKCLLISWADVFGTYDAPVVQAKFLAKGNPLPNFTSKLWKAVGISIVPNMTLCLVALSMFAMIKYGVPVVETGSKFVFREDGLLIESGLLVVIGAQVGKAVTTALLHRLVVSCFPKLSLDSVANIMLTNEGSLLLAHRVLINAISSLHQVLLVSVISSSVELTVVTIKVRLARGFAFDAERQVAKLSRLTDSPDDVAVFHEASMRLEQSRRNAMVVSENVLHAIFLEYTTVGIGTVMAAAFHSSVSIPGFGKAVTWRTAPQLLAVQFVPEVFVDAVILYYLMTSGFTIQHAWNSVCSRVTLAKLGQVTWFACFAMMVALRRD